MEQLFSKLEFKTNGEGFIDITNDLNLFIEKNNFDSGILNLTSLQIQSVNIQKTIAVATQLRIVKSDKPFLHTS